MSDRDQGSMSTTMVGAIAVVVAMLMAVVLAGGVALTQARVASAADLAALAAAAADRDARVQGSPDRVALGRGCAAARDLARRNDVTLSSCTRGATRSVIVTVSATSSAWPRPVYATARAGSRSP